MKKLKFFKCNHCGNIVVRLVDKNVPVFCCGERMEEIVANSIEAATEKHLPVIAVNNGLLTVSVGSVLHPMEAEHFINFIAVETDNGYSIKTLNPFDKPEAKFYVGESKIIKVYEYCNLHGLWLNEIK